MKTKTCILVLIMLFSFNKTKAQTSGVPDTLAYLQSIIANKAHFIGQPFSILEDSLIIDIKFFSPFAKVHHKKNNETSTSFAFFFPLSANDHYLSYPRLEIVWQTFLNKIQSDNLWNTYSGLWNPSLSTYYANAIVVDIILRE